MGRPGMVMPITNSLSPSISLKRVGYLLVRGRMKCEWNEWRQDATACL